MAATAGDVAGGTNADHAAQSDAGGGWVKTMAVGGFLTGRSPTQRKYPINTVC